MHKYSYTEYIPIQYYAIKRAFFQEKRPFQTYIKFILLSNINITFHQISHPLFLQISIWKSASNSGNGSLYFSANAGPHAFEPTPAII